MSTVRWLLRLLGSSFLGLRGGVPFSLMDSSGMLCLIQTSGSCAQSLFQAGG